MVLALLFVFLCLPVLPKGAVWPARALLLLFAAALGGWVWQKLRRIAHNPKPAIFATIALVLTAGIAYGLVEAVSWVVLQRNPVAGNPFVLTGPQKRFVDLVVNDRPNYQVYSPTLAWTIAPEQESSDKLYRSNAGGFRANREYSREVPPGKTRVLCFGDSFTHCDECGNEDTWPHQAEVAAPDMEFLNFGVPGYSLVQAFIRYTEVARRFETRHVIIGCMTEDLKRSVNVYYPLRYSNPADSPNAAALPYAALDEAGKLDIKLPMLRSREDYASLLKEPRPWIKKMIKRDVLYRHVDSTPFVTLLADRWEGLHGRLDPAVNHLLMAVHRLRRTGKSGFKDLHARVAARNGQRQRHIIEVGKKVFMRFYRDVERNDQVPLIVWFPSPLNLQKHNEGKPRDYQVYLDYFKREGFGYVDTMDWLMESAGPDGKLPLDTLLQGTHLSPSANALIGKRLAAHLKMLESEGTSTSAPRPVSQR